MNPERPHFDEEAMLAEIDRFTEDMERKLDDIDKREAEYERRRKPLPEKLYHVTTRKNSQQIMKEGIDPSLLYMEDDYVVSLSDDIDYAIGIASVTQKTNPHDLVVLEIDTTHLTPSRIRNYLREADPKNSDPLEAAEIHEVHYESIISPEAIKIVT